MKITVLNENTVYKKEYKSEHGLSLLIESGDRHILFDTGQSGLFLENAKIAQTDLSTVDAVVLSHGHYDHTGGFPYFENERQVSVYLQKNALRKKVSYKKDEDNYYFNGIPWLEEITAQEPLAKLTLLNDEIVEIFPNIYLISKIPYVTEFEHFNPKFFIETEEGYVQDDMSDEQILVVVEGNTMHIIAGCSHPGIINCIYEAKRHFPDKHIGVIVAGMHLVDAGEYRRQKTIEALLQENFELLVPMHCTGMYSIVQLKMAFEDRCKIVSTGDFFEK